MTGPEPTTLPSLNLIINSAWLLTQEAVEPEVLDYFLHQAEVAASDAAASHQQLLVGLAGQELQSAPAQLMSHAFNSLLSTLDAYRAWAENRQPEALDGLVKQAQQSANAVEWLLGL